MATKTYKIKVGMSVAEKQAVADDIINKIISGELPVQDARQIIFDNINVSLSGETVQAIIEEICDILDMKANKDGYYSQLHSGLADNLASPDGVVNEEPYTFRSTAGSTSVGSGYAKLQKLKGNTLVFNQLLKLVQNYTTNNNGISVSFDNDNNLTLNGTATDVAYVGTTNNAISIIQGHEYLFITDKELPSGVRKHLGGFVNEQGIITATESKNAYPTINIPKDTSVNVTIKPMIIDLTLMFGEGKEPTSVEEFKALFPNAYYPYNAGELIHANIQGIRTIGFNACDNEFVQVGINGETGIEWNSKDIASSKNMFRVIPNQHYTLTILNSPANINYTNLYYYDENKNFVGYIFVHEIYGVDIPSNAVYGRLSTTFEEEVDIPSDYKVCFHLTWSGYRNGEYEEHWEETRNINLPSFFEVRMMSAGSVYDELTPTKAIKRIGIVDLGTLYCSSAGEHMFVLEGVHNIKIPTSFSEKPNICCSKYEADTNNNVVGEKQDKKITVYKDNGLIYIVDTSYTDATDFKNTLSGVCLTYELATPTEEDLEQTRAIEWNYRIDDFGTEEILQSEGLHAPIGHETFYMNNIRDFIRNIGNREDIAYDPKNIVSQTQLANKNALVNLMKESIGGTLRQVLANSKSIDFNKTAWVDLGTLDWVKITSNNRLYSRTLVNLIKPYSDYCNGGNIICSKYATTSGQKIESATPNNKTIAIGGDLNSINIYDADLVGLETDEEIKQAMQGVILAYEKSEE